MSKENLCVLLYGRVTASLLRELEDVMEEQMVCYDYEG